MIFNDFLKSAFVSGFSVALVLMCFSSAPTWAKESRIILSKGAISFTCVPLKRSIKMKHFRKIIKEIKSAKKSGNTISKIITKDCVMSPETHARARMKLDKMEINCRNMDKNCAIEIRMDVSEDFKNYLHYWKAASRSNHVEMLMVDKPPRDRNYLGDALRID